MCQWDDCREGHILIALIFNTASFVLLLITSLSTPFIHSLYFLSTDTGYKYGAFGYCDPGGCSGHHLGYDTGTEMVHWLTTSLVLFPIAAGFKLIGVLGLFITLCTCGIFDRCSNGLWFRLPSFLGTVLAFFAELFALILSITGRNRYHHEGIATTYGPALWLGLAGFITGALSICCGGPAFKARYMYRANRDTPYHL